MSIVSEDGLSEDEEETRKYIYLNGKKIIEVKGKAGESGEVYYYQQDQLVSTSLVIDQDGQVVANQEYLLFGDDLNRPGVLESEGKYRSRYKYTGQYHQYEMYYYGARFYNTRVGMFITEDTYLNELNQIMGSKKITNGDGTTVIINKYLLFRQIHNEVNDMKKTYKPSLFVSCFMLLILVLMADVTYDVGFTLINSLFLLFLIICTIEFIFYKVQVDEKGIYLMRLIGTNKQIKWEEIEQLDYTEVRAVVPLYYIVDKYGVTIRVAFIRKMWELLLVISKYAVNSEVDFRLREKIEKAKKKYDI